MGLLKCEKNADCKDREEDVAAIVDEIPYMYEEEKEVNKLLCSTPSYVNSEGEKELLGVAICVPDQWCDNSYNVEHDGVRDIITFEGCKDDSRAKPGEIGAIRLTAKLLAAFSTVAAIA